MRRILKHKRFGGVGRVHSSFFAMINKRMDNVSGSYRGEEVDGVQIGWRPLLVSDVVHSSNALADKVVHLKARLQDLDGRRIHDQDAP